MTPPLGYPCYGTFTNDSDDCLHTCPHRGACWAEADTKSGIVEHELVVQIMPGGEVRSLYDEIVGLHELGVASVERITDVEWDETWQWWIPRLVETGEPLTEHGFEARVDAIAAEVAVLSSWMKEGRL